MVRRGGHVIKAARSDRGGYLNRESKNRK